jgi:hypothetical protein
MTFIVFRRSSGICYCARTNSSQLLPDNFSDIPVRRVIRPLSRRRSFIFTFLVVKQLTLYLTLNKHPTISFIVFDTFLLH